MDFILEEHGQHVDNEVDRLISQCLRTPVILRVVLEHLSNPELLKLSVVNKLWNHEARSVLRNRGLPVHLKCTDEHPCQEDIEALGVDLGPMDVAPISGISIKISHWDAAVCPCPTEDLNLSHHPILNRLSLKHGSIELLGRWWEYTDCPGFKVAKQILQHFSGGFEQLSLNVWLEREDFIEQVVQHLTFPRLRS